MICQHVHVLLSRDQVADQERDRTCAKGEGVTERRRMIGRAGILDCLFRSTDRLVRQTGTRRIPAASRSSNIASSAAQNRS